MKLFIALDDSEHSQAIVEEIVTRRFAVEPSFQLIHVIEPFNPIEPSASIPSHGAWVQFVEGVRKLRLTAGQRLLLSATERIREKFPRSEILSNFIEGYIPAQKILDLARACKADLIFVGCRGTSGLERVLLGSVSQSVVLNATCSVEVVRRESSKERGNAKKVLVAIDDSDYSDEILEMVQLQNWDEGAEIKLVTVLKPPVELLGFELGNLLGINVAEEQAKEISSRNTWLEEKSESFARQFGRAQVSTEVLIGDAREQILRAASDWQANLVVIGSHSRGSIYRLVLGSVSQAVMLHCSCSVQIVNHQDDDTTSGA